VGRTEFLAADGARPAVETRDLGKRYRKARALGGLDLRVEEGELFGIIGPDGAGKSSLLSILAGVLRFEEGECRVLGADMAGARQTEGIKGVAAFLPQGLGEHLAPELTVRENLRFFGRLHQMAPERIEERADRLLRATRLQRAESRRARHLSGGMRQKLGLACTLLHEPRLLLLDEPATGLDPVSRRELWEIVAWVMRETRATVIASTAYMDEARRFARLALLHQGRVAAQGSPEAILAKVPGRVARTDTDAHEVLQRLRRLDPNAEPRGGAARAFVRTGDAENPDREARERVREVLAGEQAEVTVHAPELEDVYLALAGEEEQQPEFSFVGVVSRRAAHNGRGVIRGQGLIRDFGEFRAVDRVDVSVDAGEVFGLLGANGAGKTTAIRMLIGLLSPTGGEASVAGVNMARARGRERNAMGYMSQVFSLYGDLTVAENLETAAGVYGLSRREAVRRRDELLEACGLRGRGRDMAGAAPLGFRQRLALGCAMVHEPGALFLDEPTSGVDPAGRRLIWEIVLQAVREGGVAALVTTHSMHEAERCDRLGLMHAGRLVASGSPARLKEDLLREAGRPLAATTDNPLAALPVLQDMGYREASLFGNSVRVLAADPGEDAQRIREGLQERGFRVHGVEPEEPAMEDVFAHHMLRHGEAS
jgi:ABC-2 type transport system ATP-binding protein